MSPSFGSMVHCPKPARTTSSAWASACADGAASSLRTRPRPFTCFLNHLRTLLIGLPKCSLCQPTTVVSSYRFLPDRECVEVESWLAPSSVRASRAGPSSPSYIIRSPLPSAAASAACGCSLDAFSDAWRLGRGPFGFCC